eukprot:1781422-Pleurochrysis_carterae.AAC.2
MHLVSDVHIDQHLHMSHRLEGSQAPQAPSISSPLSNRYNPIVTNARPSFPPFPQQPPHNRPSKSCATRSGHSSLPKLAAQPARLRARCLSL